MIGEFSYRCEAQYVARTTQRLADRINHRTLIICSKTKLDSELDTIKQLLIDNAHPEDVLVSCIKEKLANVSSEERFDPQRCPVYLKLPWIGNVSSKFENQIN